MNKKNIIFSAKIFSLFFKVKKRIVKKIHKWIEIEDGWLALINMEYDEETKEVLSENVVCSYREETDKLIGFKNMVKLNKKDTGDDKNG